MEDMALRKETTQSKGAAQKREQHWAHTKLEPWTTGDAPGQDPTPRGGLYRRQNSYTEQWVLWAPEILFYAYGRGISFCLTLCVCTQHTQHNFVENSKMDEKHKKGF